MYHYKIVYIINNKLVITKGYGVRATTIECQMGKFRVTDTIVKTRVIGLRVIDYVQTRVIKLRSVHSIHFSWKSK